MIGSILQRESVVVYESTVYPGCTEEDCVPVLEERSGLSFATDFKVGYSPERINPGDKVNTIETIVKVVSGSDAESLDVIARTYDLVVKAGTHRASSIKVAEASKIIENTQRDVNIALINELSIIFNRVGINTFEVLEAAGTKWNFLKFTPGLVGGHCIGVDPYYLTHKAQQVGYHPQIILAGRRLNDDMGAYAVSSLVKAMLRRRIQVEDARVLVLGLTFKENCPDLRNTRVVDVVRELEDYHVRVDVHDPWADPDEARAEYGYELVAEPEEGAYDAIVLAVAHEQLRSLGAAAMRRWGRQEHVLFDLKSVFPREDSDLRL